LKYIGGVKVGEAGDQLMCVVSAEIIDAFSAWKTTIIYKPASTVSKSDAVVTIAEFNTCDEGNREASQNGGRISSPIVQAVGNLLGSSVGWSDADLITTLMYLCGGGNSVSVPEVNGVNTGLYNIHAIIEDDPQVTAASKEGFSGYTLNYVPYAFCPVLYYIRGIDNSNAGWDSENDRKWE
jgi:hypothetical protein